jgi:hypothetical protein
MRFSHSPLGLSLVCKRFRFVQTTVAFNGTTVVVPPASAFLERFSGCHKRRDETTAPEAAEKDHGGKNDNGGGAVDDNDADGGSEAAAAVSCLLPWWDSDRWNSYLAFVQRRVGPYASMLVVDMPDSADASGDVDDYGVVASSSSSSSSSQLAAVLASTQAAGEKLSLHCLQALVRRLGGRRGRRYCCDDTEGSRGGGDSGGCSSSIVDNDDDDDDLGDVSRSVLTQRALALVKTNFLEMDNKGGGATPSSSKSSSSLTLFDAQSVLSLLRRCPLLNTCIVASVEWPTSSLLPPTTLLLPPAHPLSVSSSSFLPGIIVEEDGVSHGFQLPNAF